MAKQQTYIDQVLKFRTPEGVTFSLQLAGPFTRFLALIVDQAVISAGITAVSTVTMILMVLSLDFAIALMLLLQYVISIGYGIVAEWYWNGQTIGKRVLHIQVVDEKGMQLTFAQIAIRNLLRAVDMMPALYFVGGVSSLLSRKNQRLGDIAAGTVVVKIPEFVLPDFEQIMPEKFNSFRTQMHLVARLRSKVTSREAQLALQALLRRNELEPEARVEVFAELADYFKSMVPFPGDIVQNISDEQYVRNIVDVLFRTEFPVKK